MSTKSRKPMPLKRNGKALAYAIDDDSGERACRWIGVCSQDIAGPRDTVRLIAWLQRALAWQRGRR